MPGEWIVVAAIIALPIIVFVALEAFGLMSRRREQARARRPKGRPGG